MSIDSTYLARAEATGRVEVRPLHLVTALVQDRHHRYRVTVDRWDVRGTVIGRSVLTCDHLDLAAGAVHTPRLLGAARDAGGLPGLNDKVGGQWCTNGDQADLLVTSGVRPCRPQGGPPSRPTSWTIEPRPGQVPTMSARRQISRSAVPGVFTRRSVAPDASARP
jgi:cholesterol oxidase